MSSLNQVQLIGNLGKDPEVRNTQGGDAVASLSVATSEKWTDKSTGEKKEKTEWHRCVMWRKLAEIAQKYLRKGDKVFVQGKLQTRKWQDKETGQDRYATEIVVDQLVMLPSKNGGGGSRPASDDGPDDRPRESGGYKPGSYNPQHGQGKSVAEAKGLPDRDFDDDIPF